ncbi:MAG: polysaccharide deacetylase family protein [Pseudomonadota bacterium]
MLLRRYLLISLTLGLLGCVQSPVTPGTHHDYTIVAENEHFIWVRTTAPGAQRMLAEKLLGDAKQQWQIRELNPSAALAGERLLVVPKVPVNPSSVFVDGYRTIPILCYHQFTPGNTTSQRLEVSAAAFRAQLTYLRDNNYVVLSLDDVAAILDGRQAIPERAVVLTIDDGYRSVYDVAWPILQEFGFPATLYIYTDFVGGGKALSWAQMREMQTTGLIDIQSHAKSHTSLSRQTSDTGDAAYRQRVAAEVSTSAAILSSRLGSEPLHLSYPYGNSSIEAADILRDAGYRTATTVTRGENTVFSHRFLLHRTMVYDNHTLADFAGFVDSFVKKDLR